MILVILVSLTNFLPKAVNIVGVVNIHVWISLNVSSFSRFNIKYAIKWSASRYYLKSNVVYIISFSLHSQKGCLIFKISHLKKVMDLRYASWQWLESRKTLKYILSILWRFFISCSDYIHVPCPLSCTHLALCPYSC